MSADARKTSKAKLIMGIVIPVLVMVLTLVMVGVSFAWFSTSATTNIATINLTTTRCFTLGFAAGGSETAQYAGQTALHHDGYLITNYRAITTGKSGLDLEAYEADMPFMFRTTIGLSTGAPGDTTSVDLTMNFKIVQITQKDSDSGPVYDLDVYGMTSSTSGIHSVNQYNADKVPYAFTWFFLKHSDNHWNAEKEVYEPFKAATIYTPYGKMTLANALGGYRYASSLTYFDSNNQGAVTTASVNSIANLEPGGIPYFSSPQVYDSTNDRNENVLYDFYVVFAPEKLFWMQFFEGDKAKPYYNDGTNGGVYTSSQLMGWISRGQTIDDCNMMYYSIGNVYTGAEFNFTAEVNVINDVHWGS